MIKKLILSLFIASSATGPSTPGAGSVGTEQLQSGAVTAAKLASGAALSNLGLTLSGSNTGDVTIGSFGSTPTNNAMSISGQVITGQPADGTHPGFVSTASQTFAGIKTFSSAPVMSGASISSATIANSSLANTAVTNLSGTNTGDISLGAVGASPSANGASLSGQVLTLQPADASNPGVITTGTQTIAGNKTISGNLTINSLGLSASANINIPSGNSSLTFGVLGAKFTISSGFSENFAVFDTTAGVLGVSFPRNHGFAFATTLSPSGTTQTVDWATGSSQKIDAASTTGTLVLTFSDPMNGGRYILKTLGKTGRVWTFPSSVKWAGGVAPTVTATDGAKDMFQFIYDAGDSTYIGSIIAQNAS